MFKKINIWKENDELFLHKVYGVFGAIFGFVVGIIVIMKTEMPEEVEDVEETN